MANRQFSQYLLNRGILSSDNAGRVLAKSLHAVPDLAVLALEKGLITSQQAKKLLGVKEFVVAALEENYLNALQLDELKKAVPDRSACLGQVLLEEGIVDIHTLARLFEDSKDEDSHPVDDVIKEMLEAQGWDAHEHAYIREYVKLFLKAMRKFMHTEALIIPNEDLDLVDATYLIYQSMGGALRLTVGCRMTGNVLLAMAGRFSGEEETEVNEMAIDSIEELANVINGLYIVNMSGHSHDMDLDMPRTLENGVPAGEDVFALRVETEFGAFMLYLSREGFMLNEKNLFGW